MDNHKNILKGFTKQEIINYLDVKDRLTDAKNSMTITDNKINYTDMMLYTLPFILVLIAILVIYLVYKNNKKDIKNKKEL
jgi:cytochrome c-type biogenesis protein CcmH/NrfF